MSFPSQSEWPKLRAASYYILYLDPSSICQSFFQMPLYLESPQYNLGGCSTHWELYLFISYRACMNVPEFVFGSVMPWTYLFLLYNCHHRSCRRLTYRDSSLTNATYSQLSGLYIKINGMHTLKHRISYG